MPPPGAARIPSPNRGSLVGQTIIYYKDDFLTTFGCAQRRSVAYKTTHTPTISDKPGTELYLSASSRLRCGCEPKQPRRARCRSLSKCTACCANPSQKRKIEPKRSGRRAVGHHSNGINGLPKLFQVIASFRSLAGPSCRTPAAVRVRAQANPENSLTLAVKEHSVLCEPVIKNRTKRIWTACGWPPQCWKKRITEIMPSLCKLPLPVWPLMPTFRQPRRELVTNRKAVSRT